MYNEHSVFVLFLGDRFLNKTQVGEVQVRRSGCILCGLVFQSFNNHQKNSDFV